MLICTTTFWCRHHYHPPLWYGEGKPRNLASGQRWDLNPGNPGPEFTLSATMLCCDFPTSWSIFIIRDVLFFPPKSNEFPFPMSLSRERFHPWALHPSSPQVPRTVFALWGDFLPNIPRPHLLTHSYQLWVIWCLSARVNVYPAPQWLTRGTFPGNIADGHFTVVRCLVSESLLLPRNLLVFGKRTATQTQVQSDMGPIFIQHDLLPALDCRFPA